MTEQPKKVAIVTGASGGIGAAVALRLAGEGFTVVANYAGRSTEADKTVAAITAQGGKAISVSADVADPTSVAALFARTKEAFGRCDVVVHCAGIMPLSPITEGDVALFDKVIAVNLRGSFLILAAAAKEVAEGGRIIAFSSSVLAKSFPGYGAYIASKAGVEGLVHVLANELRGRNITVNAVAPGPVATPLFLNGKTQAQIDELAKVPPLERLGQPSDIADVVSFIAGAQGGWINSQVLRSNGGFA
ncbi:3-oxoacyl-[acyl-carrier-protein] reductase FabG [Starkeya nomas]|uniref:3-oxoacyl-[acyl-carrier-protein] reductase FabG n=1 Tax=Starkeya nomas TaxID=2666134 RepID=A0A5S9NI81_9HYPH|nr:SDR family oxidoreductase [Starkeya nomas]CAA0090302.1 3-oxoacyl-[acyl-carrier-protein] reductase FabG [Starkeya nomas]